MHGDRRNGMPAKRSKAASEAEEGVNETHIQKVFGNTIESVSCSERAGRLVEETSAAKTARCAAAENCRTGIAGLGVDAA